MIFFLYLPREFVMSFRILVTHFFKNFEKASSRKVIYASVLKLLKCFELAIFDNCIRTY